MDTLLGIVAVVLAQQNNIPVFNLWYPEVVERFNNYLRGMNYEL